MTIVLWHDPTESTVELYPHWDMDAGNFVSVETGPPIIPLIQLNTVLMDSGRIWACIQHDGDTTHAGFIDTFEPCRSWFEPVEDEI